MKHWFNRNPVPQQPVAPASAYEVVASLLPESFFKQPSPRSGYRFEVIGNDGRPTEWHIPAHLANNLEHLLRASRRIRSVKVVPFEVER